jgi:hypothetical protein
VEIWRPRAGVLAGWKQRQASAYSGNHGAT